MRTRHDTIAAIATPPGLGGIAILRLSGPDALAVLTALFTPAQKKPEPFFFRPRYLHYGQARDADGFFLDEALAVHMPGPHSATGEDVGEIHCHGGTGVTAALLEAALNAGARLAGPGEFTRRAFMNGRMDLTRAEAVAEIVNAATREGARLAAAKLDGGLASIVADLRASLDALRAQAILAVDFPDEDAELLPREDFVRTVRQGRALVHSLLAAFMRARLWREGALAALVGRVNVGKSSLLNSLIGRPRAIVSEEPGTTRDYLEESVNLRGLPLRLADTAGLRETGGSVENEGMRRALSLAEEAELILFVADARRPLESEDHDFFRRREDKLRQGRIVLVMNKIDLAPPEPAALMRGRLVAGAPKDLAGPLLACPCFAVSARTGAGLEDLAEGLRLALAAPGSCAESVLAAGDIAPNLRQSRLLQQADEELRELERALDLRFPPDILSVHLDAAALCLDEVTGAADNEELLDRIFASFCIGK